MPPRNQNDNPNRNPYERGSGYDFRNRQQQLDQKFDALKIKEIEDLEEILEKQAEVFAKEKKWLEAMIEEVRDKKQENKIPRDMPLDFELKEAAQNIPEAMANTICANNELIDKMVRVCHKLREIFPFLKNVTLIGEAPDADTADDGRDRDADRGRPDRAARPENQKKRADEAMEAVAFWYIEETKSINEGNAPMNKPPEVQEQEGNEDYKRLADPRKINKMVVARQKWERAGNNYQPKENEKKKKEDITEALNKLELAREWLSKLEEKVNDANSDLADVQAEFNKIGGHPNVVFQAREFIREKNLATDDKIKPENNKMEKRLEEIEKKIKEREKEKLKTEVKEVLNKLNAFLAEIQKQPGEFGPRFDTVEKRSHEWDELLAEIQPVLVRANAVPATARELREDLLPAEELRTRKIPEELAKAALRTAR
ncbi:MAG: hypothetical protein HZC26_04375, partial [Candidatus Magasanikbacteria bacterium]|nr:hypothetical protein [Candidatus Magasanikbacteria bacterium]